MSVHLSNDQQNERLQELWRNYGNVFVNVIIACLIGIVSWQFWTQYQTDKTDKASVLYERLLDSAVRNDNSGIEAFGNSILKNHPGTMYAHLTSMLMAKMDFENNKIESAIKRLQEVREATNAPEIKQICRIREARAFVSTKQFDKALSLLKQADDDSFATLVEQLKGDIYLLQGDLKKAKQAYRLALGNDEDIRKRRVLLQMRYQHIPDFQKRVATSTTQGAKA